MLKKIILFTLLFSLLSISARAANRSILNVSYDPTREFYQEYNALFIKHWQETKREKIYILQSHGGSGKQARSVIDGLKADVVTLALSYDIDAIAKQNLLDRNWQKRLNNNSSPYTSTILFLVRKGNPKHIKDWDDLIKPGISVITPNPKTSGAARWNYLAAYFYALSKNNNNPEKANEFMTKLFKNVPVLDSGARGSTTTFAQRNIGDVLLSWENEALLIKNKIGKGQYEVITPSVSILAEPSVAVVDKVVDNKKTRDIAEEYLKFLYSNEAQEIIAKNYYRPSNIEIARKYINQFPVIKLLNIADYGGWETLQQKHFNDGGTFDKIYNTKK